MVERRTRRRPGENRRRLLEAGLVEFGLFGYHGASTSGIAARAGVPQPHVYASFATKQELFLACLERLSELGESSELDEPGESTDDKTRTDQDALQRFLHQAVAASRDPALGETVNVALSALRLRAGDRRFEELLARGALLLLDV
ncbi:MAG: helix-turn-helix domain-containing protein [Leucobacter sp.]